LRLGDERFYLRLNEHEWGHIDFNRHEHIDVNNDRYGHVDFDRHEHIDFNDDRYEHVDVDRDYYGYDDGHNDWWNDRRHHG